MKKLILVLFILCLVMVCKAKDIYKENSVYVQFLSFVNPTLPTVNLEKIFWIKRGIGVGVCAGAVLIEDRVTSRISGSLLLGGPKHSFQPEMVILARGFTIFVFNYKYQTNSGFYIKGGITTRIGTVPALGVGYSF